jgi:hypothetical protein
VLAGCAGGDAGVREGEQSTPEAEVREEGLAGEPVNAGTAAFTVQLIPRAGVSGSQRVNFAVPLPRGFLSDTAKVRVRRSGVDIAVGRRALARYGDGSIRSLQIQVNVQISGQSSLEVRLGEQAVAGSLALVPVANTLVSSSGAQVPRVWVTLPATWLSASGVAGPLVTEASVAGNQLKAWNDLCDYESFNLDAFLPQQSDGAVWLYVRGTTFYRGYARRGDIGTLTTAYRETSIYRSGITGSGSSVDIGVPGKQGDLKYFYAQNLAIHYLLTGDDRFRESAEQIAYKASLLWNPWYDGGWWTERHAGFQLLAYVWAANVSDNRAAEFAALADELVDASIDLQESSPPGYNSQTHRCFAHTADAHGEPFGGWGCSPWMSAILADGLDAYAAERTGTRAAAARTSLVKLGRIIASEGRDGAGRPFYWMGVGNNPDEPDDYNEHWGEAAYIVALAWYHGGKQELSLKNEALELVQGFANYGEVGQLRSFNWQCRSAVATPFFLK